MLKIFKSRACALLNNIHNIGSSFNKNRCSFWGLGHISTRGWRSHHRHLTFTWRGGSITCGQCGGQRRGTCTRRTCHSNHWQLLPTRPGFGGTSFWNVMNGTMNVFRGEGPYEEIQFVIHRFSILCTADLLETNRNKEAEYSMSAREE